MRGGKRLGPPLPLADSRDHFRAEFATVPERHKALRSPERYPIRVGEGLGRLTQTVVAEAKRRELRTFDPGRAVRSVRPS
jgi:nicotinate phosphoribosyltransferase